MKHRQLKTVYDITSVSLFTHLKGGDLEGVVIGVGRGGGTREDVCGSRGGGSLYQEDEVVQKLALSHPWHEN